MKIQNYIKLIFIVFCVASSNSFAGAAENKQKTVTEKFSVYTENSKYSIDYSDYTALLKKTVLVMGHSTRQKAAEATGTVGTRFKSQKKVYTAREGNRFFFEAFQRDEDIILLTKIRKSLETLPDDAPLQAFSKDEQLAYWLNLYNVTLLEELCKHPANKLKKMLTGKKSFLNKKVLTVAGVKLSLNDIHHKILLPNFGDDAVVIYGLFQGNIGGPNIRNHAYNGSNVYSKLRNNAAEFINSNRGTFSRKKGKMSVSKFYDVNKSLFPDFNRDLRRHLANFARGEYKYKIDDASKFKPNITDWTIVRLTGDNSNYGGSVSKGEAAMMNAIKGNGIGSEGELGGRSGSPAYIASTAGLRSMIESNIKGYGRLSPDEVKIFKELKQKYYEDKGIVYIEEVNKSELKKKEKK